MSSALVSIMGPPASGKTTLAENLAGLLPARIIREDYTGNPFLADSYTHNGRAKLPGQLYFLLSRVNQLSRRELSSAGLCVSDYAFCQDAIFASLRLSESDMQAYSAVAERVAQSVRSPDVIIWLRAPVKLLLERIAARARDYEKAMSAEFLDEISKQYAIASDNMDCSVIELDSESVNVRDIAECRRIGRKVREKL